MALMWNIEKDAAGMPIAGKRVTISLLANDQPAYSDSQVSIESIGETVTDGYGRWELDLEPNIDLVPAGTVYSALLRFRGGDYTHLFTAPDAPGLNWIGDNLAEIPGDLPSGALSGHLSGAVGAHAASAVSVVPAGGLVAANAQLALVELDAEISAESVLRISADDALALALASTDENVALKLPLTGLGLGGTEASDQLLKGWVAAEAFELTAINRDANDIITTATVKWNDGSGGLFTTTSLNSSPPAINAFTITHTLSGKTVTQAAMTRNVNGAVTVKPELTVA